MSQPTPNLHEMKLPELREIGKGLGLEFPQVVRKDDVVASILAAQGKQPEPANPVDSKSSDEIESNIEPIRSDIPNSIETPDEPIVISDEEATVMRSALGIDEIEAKLDVLLSRTAIGAYDIKVEPEMAIALDVDPGSLNVADADHLRAIAASARARAAEVAERVNPTNVFVLKYERVALDCEELLNLFAARGHAGIPEGH